MEGMGERTDGRLADGPRLAAPSGAQLAVPGCGIVLRDAAATHDAAHILLGRWRHLTSLPAPAAWQRGKRRQVLRRAAADGVRRGTGMHSAPAGRGRVQRACCARLSTWQSSRTLVRAVPPARPIVAPGQSQATEGPLLNRCLRRGGGARASPPRGTRLRALPAVLAPATGHRAQLAHQLPPQLRLPGGSRPSIVLVRGSATHNSNLLGGSGAGVHGPRRRRGKGAQVGTHCGALARPVRCQRVSSRIRLRARHQSLHHRSARLRPRGDFGARHVRGSHPRRAARAHRLRQPPHWAGHPTNAKHRQSAECDTAGLGFALPQ
mmetsp:Transcript_1574/g.5103  ORF Transcript_1574/g.5103 Transcript_1574/m.5103 type:complete len:321 (-) Transcript_1574:7893-8855(-)